MLFMNLRPGIVIFLLLFSLHSTAQVVNIENARMQTDTTGWKGEINGSFALVDNGVKLWLIGADAHVQYKTEKDLWLALGTYGLQKSPNQKFSDQGLGHIRYNRKMSKSLRWEVFSQLQYNAVSNIDYRFLAGTGPRFKIAGNSILRLYAATSVMYEHEKETGSGILHNDARNSTYLSFTLTPSASTEISATSYYQPLFNDFSDYRILTQARLKVKAGKNFAVTMRWYHLFDRRPAGSSPKEIYSFSTGLSYEF